MKLTFLLFFFSFLPATFAEVPSVAPSDLFDSLVAKPIRVLSGFEVPECALYDETGSALYVSNIVCGPDGHWEDDGHAFLSKVKPNFEVDRRWAMETDGLNAPKGMCILQGSIYYADNSRLVGRSLSQPNKHKVSADGFKMANDVVTDGKNVWVSDIALNKIFCVTPNGDKRSIRSPPGVNGISFSRDKMYAVSWSEHDVFEVDPTGDEAPRAFGLSRHFKNLDGLEILPDGSMIVSDFTGNKVCLISADEKRTRVLIEIRSPADIGFNPLTRQLAIPQLSENKVAVYQLEWE